nr:PPE domain-containing protein [Mycobacterium tuberculosis]
MVDFGALPPEINSARMYAGPGSASLVAAAQMWDSVASDLFSAASAFQSVVWGLTSGVTVGPAARAACSTVPAASAATAGPRSLSGVTAGPAAGPERSATAVTAATAGLPTPPAVAAATAAMAGTPD